MHKVHWLKKMTIRSIKKGATLICSHMSWPCGPSGPCWLLTQLPQQPHSLFHASLIHPHLFIVFPFILCHLSILIYSSKLTFKPVFWTCKKSRLTPQTWYVPCRKAERSSYGPHMDITDSAQTLQILHGPHKLHRSHIPSTHPTNPMQCVCKGRTKSKSLKLWGSRANCSAGCSMPSTPAPFSKSAQTRATISIVTRVPQFMDSFSKSNNWLTTG